jgi:hypothetical protein
MSNVVEALQQSDSDGCHYKDEGKRPPAEQRHCQKKSRFGGDIADHSLVPPMRVERPCFAELPDNRAHQEGIKALAQSRRRRVIARRGAAVVTVQVGYAEMHVEDAREQHEAERPLSPVAAMDHLMRSHEPEYAGADARRERHAGGFEQAARGLCNEHRCPHIRRELEDHVDPRNPT